MFFFFGIWGSVFCVIFSYYYCEICFIICSIVGFGFIDGFIWNNFNEDFSKVYFIDFVLMLNFVYGMYGKLLFIVFEIVYDNENI